MCVCVWCMQLLVMLSLGFSVAPLRILSEEPPPYWWAGLTIESTVPTVEFFSVYCEA